MRIPDSLLLAARSLDIVEVVSRFSALTESRGYLTGLCPFHEDTHPSLRVSREHNGFKCFVCETSGDGIAFYQHLSNVSFSDAVTALAQDFGLEVEPETPEEKEELGQKKTLRAGLMLASKAMASAFHRLLLSPEGAESMDYLAGRGISLESIKKNQLGFAPDSYRRTLDYLVSRFGDDGIAWGLASGLIKQKNDTLYDSFRNRLMIPIKNSRGDIVAFGGRDLGSDGPKYINSCESPIFIKSQTVFGISEARDAVKRQKEVIITEGYLDVLALRQAGIENAVACMGTAFTRNHALQILALTRSGRIVVSLDSDPAGMKATQRTIDNFRGALGGSISNLRILELSGAKDPDEFLARKSAEEFRVLVRDALGVTEWGVNTALRLVESSSPSEAIAAVISVLRKCENDLLRKSFSRKAAEVLTQGDIFAESSLRSRIFNESTSPAGKAKSKDMSPKTSLELGTEREIQILSLAFREKSLIGYIQSRLDNFAYSFSSIQVSSLWGILKASDGMDLAAVRGLAQHKDCLAELERVLWRQDSFIMSPIDLADIELAALELETREGYVRWLSGKWLRTKNERVFYGRLVSEQVSKINTLKNRMLEETQTLVLQKTLEKQNAERPKPGTETESAAAV